MQIVLTILGLSLFEIISSIDNAIINAEVLHTMSVKSRRWFLLWGIIIAVFVVRGLLPFLIVWLTIPDIGFTNAIVSVFSGNPSIMKAVEASSPVLLLGGGTFLIFLFFDWLFLEPKEFGLFGERFFQQQGVWFFTVISIILAVIVWFAIKINPILAFGSVIGSTAFFITHGFKNYAGREEERLLNKKSGLSDLSKLIYLEVIDATFSVDGVIGAFAFTLYVPLIFLGNSLGAIILRNITIGNIHRIKKYKYLKNGAMYSVLFLGIIMTMGAFGFNLPEWLAPALTFWTVGYFFIRSRAEVK